MAQPLRIQHIVVNDPPPLPPHPCTVGVHRWAWAILNRGGERQVCYDCGHERA